MKIGNFFTLATIFIAAFSFVSCGDDDDDNGNEKGNETEIAAGNHEYVDLGLPSGTLWATCNVGASKPEDYGVYFAWGETKPKDSYDWSTYKWFNSSGNTLIKYCTDSHYGTVDNKTELDPKDDAATANWGSDWRMPSLDQIDELWFSGYTTTEWTTLNGVNGRLITSKKNGKTLFLPAVGERKENSLKDVGSEAHYLSRSLDTVTDNPFIALCLYFLSDGIGHFWDYRCYGCSVRPVRSKGKVKTSIDGITDNQKVAESRKYISGGNLIIEKDGKQYNLDGTKAK